ncbi:hypothetical protein [Kitasatospora cinereorecta]|uniref:DUF4232 domain-containing protein n=1 Tax=Kitasatospora cinereorecta TaxID=285560 RepID=A0ABW0VC20_9ACTN
MTDAGRDGTRPPGERPSGERLSGERFFGERRGSSSPLAGPDGLTERELRSRLRLSVAMVEPDPAALPRLRAAVPRRRARRRGALTGAAVALVAAASLPVLHGVDPFFDLSGDSGIGAIGPSDGGHPAHATPGGPSTAPLPHPTAAGGGPTGGSASVASAAASPSGGPSEGTPAAPACAGTDLGRADSRVDPADGSGRMYGWFRLANTSSQSCRIAEVGTLAVASASGAGGGSVRVVGHTAGDPATGLPDPAGAPRELLLTPGASFVVRFGWVPTRSCDAPTAAPTAQLAPQPVQAVAISPGPGTTPAAAPSAGPGDGTSPTPSTPSTASPTPTASTAGGGVTLGYAPSAGGPTVATAVLKGACDGTVYQAAPEPAPTATPAPSATAQSTTGT